MFYKCGISPDGRNYIRVSDLGQYSLTDTLECGQCFRHELIRSEGGYTEYMTVIGDTLVFVGQRDIGELIFYDIDEDRFNEVIRPYFTLDTDYGKIRDDITARTDSEWLKRAAGCGGGIAILKQDAWETLISFIISQNNNIPRIKKIIRKISGEYGANICLQNGIVKCPLSKIDTPPCHEKCKECGICYTFPKAEDIRKNPEGLLVANPGFRYKYLCDATEKVASGEVNLDMIAAARSAAHTVECLMKIKGVGLKVASCCALFAFSNLEAFPIDVWMKRAIDTYFDGKLDPVSLGRYAGVAQQYIFHYIRNTENNS